MKNWMLPISNCVKSVCIWSYSGPYLVPMRENTEQNNSEYEHFLRSVSYKLITFLALASASRGATIQHLNTALMTKENN